MFNAQLFFNKVIKIIFRKVFDKKTLNKESIFNFCLMKRSIPYTPKYILHILLVARILHLSHLHTNKILVVIRLT